MPNRSSSAIDSSMKSRRVGGLERAPDASRHAERRRLSAQFGCVIREVTAHFGTLLSSLYGARVAVLSRSKSQIDYGMAGIL